MTRLEAVYCPNVALAHADELDSVRSPFVPRYRLPPLLIAVLGGKVKKE